MWSALSQTNMEFCIKSRGTVGVGEVRDGQGGGLLLRFGLAQPWYVYTVSS